MQRAIYCRIFTPAQPDNPAASVRDFCSGAYIWVYVTDLSIKSLINDIFAKVFGDKPPARNFIEVRAIGENAIVELSMIALCNDQD